MTEARPQTGPGESPEGVGGGGAEVSMPKEMPPVSAVGGVSAEGLVPPAADGDTSPSLPAEAGVAAAITAWNSNMQITALWSMNQDRNSWVGVGGIGWKKLANNSSSAIVALTMLSAHAREKGSVVNYRDESDGMIHEMYVW
jgi:hypothetical protein